MAYPINATIGKTHRKKDITDIRLTEYTVLNTATKPDNEINVKQATVPKDGTPPKTVCTGSISGLI